MPLKTGEAHGMDPGSRCSTVLNWRRDPGYEQRMSKLRSETEQIRKQSEQPEKETEQLRHENARLRQLNARGRTLLSSAALLYSAPDSSSIPPSPTAQG
jgi:hypothetical protein